MLYIANAHIKTMAGADIPKGGVLIDNGKIVAVGTEEIAPTNAEVIDAGGRLVTPGLIDAHTHIGLCDEGMRWEGKDHDEKSDCITPHMRAIDAFYPQDPCIPKAVRGGVTTVCVGPGSTNVVGGTFAALKLSGSCVDDMILKFPVAMKCAFGENPKSSFGQGQKKMPYTRMGIAAMLRELLFKARAYREEKDGGGNPKFDIKLEAMLPVMRGEIPMKCHAHRCDDILTAIRIAKEFDIKITLDHCTDGERVADKIAAAGFPAFVGPSSTAIGKPELVNKALTTPGALQRAGIQVSIITDSPVIVEEDLALCAGRAAQYGMDTEEAWKAITVNPAESLNIHDRVGTLEKGKDADIVIWTADPLTTVGGHAYMTLINGKVVYTEA